MFLLKNWSLCLHGNEVYAAGIVFDNPKFAQGGSITTSIIVERSIENDAFVATTYSGSQYEMKF